MKALSSVIDLIDVHCLPNFLDNNLYILLPRHTSSFPSKLESGEPGPVNLTRTSALPAQKLMGNRTRPTETGDFATSFAIFGMSLTSRAVPTKCAWTPQTLRVIGGSPSICTLL